MRHDRVPLVVGYATIAAMLPYLTIKLAWLAGSDVGVTEPGAMLAGPMAAANAVTAGMELFGAALVLALVQRWGLRVPAIFLLLPLWVGTGLLGPVVTGAPLAALVRLVAGDQAVGESAAAGANVLQPWVYFVVYSGFILQALGLTWVAVHHVRARWGRLLASTSGAGSGDPAPGRRVLLSVAVAALTVPAVCARCYWAFGGEPAAGTVTRTLDVVAAAFVVAGVAGLYSLLWHRPQGMVLGTPIAAVWLGAGTMTWFNAFTVTVALFGDASSPETGGARLTVLLLELVAGVLIALTAIAEVNALARRPSGRCGPGLPAPGRSAHHGRRGAGSSR